MNSFRINNLFLIDELDIAVDNGFVAITGESGAGKSMIVRALTLLTGRKATGVELREGMEKGFIEAVFYPAEPTCSKLSNLCEETATEWILRREFRSGGRSRAFINDTPVTNNVLGSACDLVLRFSLQEDVGELRDPVKQLAFVDNFAGHEKLVRDVATAYHHWKQASEQLQELQERSRTERDVWELAREEYHDLKALGYESGQRDALKAERERLRNLEAVRTAYESLSDALDGEHGSARSALNAALNAARGAMRWDSALTEYTARIEEQSITIRELAREIEHTLSHLNGDTNRLEAIEQRLQAIADCERKWRINAEMIPERMEKLHQSTAQYESLDQAITATEREVGQRVSTYLTIAEKLTQNRKKAVESLFKQTTHLLPTLGIAQSRLIAQWSERQQPAETGMDELQILFSANSDVPPRELGLVISGGELARLELALLNASGFGDTTTLILDEVDRGVSGRIASAVGKCLRTIGSHRSVVMVTHLPQVAAAAHQHIAIEKAKTGSRTRITARILNQEERVNALAAMLGGKITGKGAVTGAQELLSEARQ